MYSVDKVLEANKAMNELQDNRKENFQKAKEEVQEKLKEIDGQLQELRKKRNDLIGEFDKLNIPIIRFEVGDRIITSEKELGRIVSVEGPENCPIIALIHRNDTGKDDIGFFDWYGMLGGYNKKYTIDKIKM